MLSILSVTKAEPFAIPFLRRMAILARECHGAFVIAADGPAAMRDILGSDIAFSSCVPVFSRGYLESVLDDGVAACSDGYVLRLDDDEFPTQAMCDWLLEERYETEDHWKFARLHLWGDTQHFLDDPQLWPDHQTRLSLKHMSGGRFGIHSPSPFGGGALAPYPIEHHKFLVKSVEERRAIAAKWHGGGMLAFSVPEDARDSLVVRPVEEAHVR